MLDHLTVQDFQPLVGQGFRVSYPGHSETLILNQAERVANSGLPQFGREGFSLIFESESREIVLHQQIHALENQQLGRLELFLVPVGRTPQGSFLYQAAFC